ncbi:MAG: SH3 domain-containing protein [Clostridia bacterium]|nr:SH3 domain-containing protein [Clostridia bacterium]
MKKFICFIFTVATALLCMTVSASALNSAGRVETQGGRLNIRSSPSSSGAVKGSLENGTWLTLKGKSGSWYLAEYAAGKEGYVSESYIKTYPKSVDGTVKLKSGSLNVRSGAGTSHKVIDSLRNGERVVVVKSNDTWCAIVYRGSKTGYVAKAYLERTNEDTSVSYPAVSLSVPSFRQTDSRWKSYPIGTQGGTIGTIGCTTTALAMTESFYQGYVVTPPNMAKKLSYSASGSLYWPSTYSVSNVTADYLKEIYRILKSGKPVVFGMKKANGSQHWVTVYGYEGGETLSHGRFLINDPGSETRRNLQSVMDAYPIAYRIAYRK